jgi:hypothetical protein
LADKQALPFDEDDEYHKEEVEDEEPTYCGDLDEVEIALPRDGNGFEYHLVLNDEHPTEDDYKEVQQDMKRTRKEMFWPVLLLARKHRFLQQGELPIDEQYQWHKWHQLPK